MLRRLNLQDRYQDKLTTADFLSIGSPATQQHELKTEKDLAHTFLHRLLMLDYRARYIPVRDEENIGNQTTNILTDDNLVDTEETVFDVIFNRSLETDQKANTHVHPMDVQMAVFHCSDSFLRQQMVTKLSMCQYAVPLLVPDPFTKDIECPLWTFRQIRKSWKFTDSSNVVTSKTMPICNAETPMVSFFRLGSVSSSKSHLLNTLINERHSTFFHRHCPGSTKSRHLMEGVAEIAWYCPAGKPNDAFPDCIAFCNLHGDAVANQRQLDILTDNASVNVVLLPTMGKNDKSMTILSKLFNSPKPLICLLTEDDSAATEITQGKYKIGLKDRNQSDVSEELKGIIRKTLLGSLSCFKLETMAHTSRIKVDEDGKDCQTGKIAALQTLDQLKGVNLSKIKETCLPCQGILWHNWSRKNKDLYRLRGNLEMEKCKIQRELKQIRLQQKDAALSELMQLFIANLQSLAPNERIYFLKWVGILLDDLLSDELKDLHHEYDEKWSEVLALKKKHDKSKQLKKKQMELEQISEKLQSATVGFEHILREMGQIYEAFTSLRSGKEREDMSYLPELAAELMISGHPMELMDGDAAHVPLIWISAVLDEVIKKLGDKKVFVLSVLGIQSTGKSTMLNAMFGLEFAVSAGRCTRGAFMQLVKVTSEMQKDLLFDYVLVVDTEGLRALELAGKETLHHDNELATFVIGLGNMTLINIFGENPAEMQDIIQIAVQAFMRMKKINLSPSCVFVHQNVADITAGEKNMEGKRRLQDKLDEMTQLAAKEEVFDAECFSDVIAFDIQSDVKYFAQLWEGSPPMAPPNPSYSENIQELKNKILPKTSKSRGMRLSKFKSNIQDLWNALLNENFVFSFKNTLEITVYRKLEDQFMKWTWALRRAMLTIENRLHNRIENGKLNKIEQTTIFAEIKVTQAEVEKNMKEYFDEDRDKEMLVQWRGRFECKMLDFHDNLVKEAKRKLEEMIQQRDACKKLDKKQIQYENKLFQKSKELALQLKDKAMKDIELQKEFDAVWGGWVSDLTEETPCSKDIDISDDSYQILEEIGLESSVIHDRKCCNRYSSICDLGDYSEYVTLNKHKKDQYDSACKPEDTPIAQDTKGNQVLQMWTTIKNAFKKRIGFEDVTNTHKLNMEGNLSGITLTHRDQESIKALANDVVQKCEDIIKAKPVEQRGYNIGYMGEIAALVKDRVNEHVSSCKKYALRKEFLVDLALHVCKLAGCKLTQSHEKFKLNNDALTYLTSKRRKNFEIFKSLCKGTTSVAVQGDLICNKLKESMVQTIYDKTAIDLAGEMQVSLPPFSGNRSNLENHILQSLAEEEHFGKFMNYIHHPQKHFQSYISETVEKYLLTENSPKALSIVKHNSTLTEDRVSHAIHAATLTVKRENGDIHMWIREVSKTLSDELKFTENGYGDFNDITDFDFLEEVVMGRLKTIVTEINTSLSRLSQLRMDQFRKKPDEILIKQFCSCCWVQCPFCKAICTNTMGEHSPNDHMVPFHRPYGINGWHKKTTECLSINFCTTSVASTGYFHPHYDQDEKIPWKTYRSGGPKYADWCITPDLTELPYWKWFVCRFKDDLEKYYRKKFEGLGKIPSEWMEYTKEQAIESLKKI